MTVHRTDAEQHWRDYDEGLHDPGFEMERVRPARLTDMSWPTGDVTVDPQPEFEPRTVRSHEVRSYGKTSLAEWLFLIGGITLCAAWLMLLAAVMYAVTVG